MSSLRKWRLIWEKNTSGSILSFYIHEFSSYGYLHVLPWFHANLSSSALNCLGHHWCDETPCLDAWSHSPWKGEYFKHLMQPHTIWCGMVNELNPTFFYFIDDSLHYITHLGKGYFCGGQGCHNIRVSIITW